MSRSELPVSIVVPTYGREQVLIDSIVALLNLDRRAAEILVVDQTARHTAATESQLQAWHDRGSIQWVRRDRPSITAAMNQGLRLANNALVLFLDDDIVPQPALIYAHWRTYRNSPELWATVGQVIQPGESAMAIRPSNKLDGLRKDFDFPFNSTLDAMVENVKIGRAHV